MNVKENLLYDPQYEHDACGMGFITQINGHKSHQLVEKALTMLQRMNHRGGTGAEPDTGDGAGILLQISDAFFQEQAKLGTFSLPPKNFYGIGQFFVPKKQTEKEAVLKALVEEIQNEGITVLGQREVPFVYEACGPTAQKAMPGFVQLFIGKPEDIQIGRPFEDVLFQLRRHLEKTFSDDELSIVSLSSQTIVYKGMLHAYQVGLFYPDLHDVLMDSAICLVHSRFSTNTFPSWDRAQPYRFLAHNGEINTLKGAENWMTAHNIEIYNEDNSDSAKLENCMEYLYRHGRDIPEILLMMVPEAWSKSENLSQEQRAFDEYNESFMSPWDGPAALCFTDGTQVGAALDRNGLRPARYILDDQGVFVVASESGVVDIQPQSVIQKGILGPSDMILVDTKAEKFYTTEEIKAKYANQYPYHTWLSENQLTLEALPKKATTPQLTHAALEKLWRRHGYTDDIIREAILPIAQKGEEPIISMGYDAPLAVLSERPQSLFTYFKQQFAQVTNPPIDAIREDFVIGTEIFLGSDQDITRPLPQNAQKIKLQAPILTATEFAKLRDLDRPGFKAACVSVGYDLNLPPEHRLGQALDDMFKTAEAKIDAGATLLILTDREVTPQQSVIPILLATAGLNQYLVQKGKRGKTSIIVESAEPCEIHHYAMLLGYGASAICPYGVYETIQRFDLTPEALTRYVAGSIKGIVKIMSRMGISTISGYQGAQLFEAIGLSKEVVTHYFSGTASRIEGIGLDEIEKEYLKRYQKAYGINQKDDLDSGGSFKYRVNGEHHLYNPVSLFKFQQAIRTKDYQLFKDYTREMNNQALDQPTTLRSMWYFDYGNHSVPIQEVEPIETIVKRFKTGAMSYGALSEEAHETIATAMNRLGAKSNSGEGGEHERRFKVQKDGRNLNSKIKQVASARFGVNAAYLMSAEEIQIKMAQGAKPGEGGQLAAKKNYPWVAECRGATPGVRLISPPPHHDIYSIEDLKQLIFDLKQVNPYAKVTVKLVASTGVGTIVAGVVKAGADKVTISGYDGGTGAAPRTSVRDAGLPWEMGVADAHQTLWLNHLRQRTTIETDGKLMTGRDIAVAALLGAEEFNFGSLTLCAIGCIMMRVCSLNTCPTGICTQDPKLRKQFTGKPEDIECMMRFLAEDLREIMAKLGYRTVDEMVGHTEHLKPRFVAKGKAKQLNFDKILGTSFGIQRKRSDPFAPKKHWPELDDFAETALKQSSTSVIQHTIDNTQRAVGSRMGGWIAEHFGNQRLEPGKIQFQYTGVAGQSFGAFITQGLSLKLIGEANDYVGKGLSGGRLIVEAPRTAKDLYSQTTVVGNVACFGATSGQAYFNGRAGERFCVRNSGADVVVEGIGDHGCEYMTGGHVVILGSTGRNFGAGMSGGIAYVYDPVHQLKQNLNPEMVALVDLETQDEAKLKALLKDHVRYTQSTKAIQILDAFEYAKKDFVKVYPKDFHRIQTIVDTLQQQFKNASKEDILEQAFEIATTQKS